MADTKISALTSRSTPASSDVVPVAASGVTYKVSFLNFIRTLIGLEKVSGTNNYVLNAADNTIDSSAVSSSIVSSANSSMPNKIGVASGLPVGTDLNPGWSADTGYVSGAASFSAISGGYDNVCNATGSQIISNHSMISYSVEGHNTIIGNSYDWIAGGRSTIVGARQSSIQAGSTYGVILGGDNNDITSGGDYQTIIGGVGNTVSSTLNRNTIIGVESGLISGATTGSSIIGGISCTISGSSNYSAIIGGNNCTLTGVSYSAIIGSYLSTVTASRSAVIAGESCTVAKNYALATGNSCVPKSGGSITVSSGALVNAGDCQMEMANFKVRTTNSTITNMSTADGFIELDDAKKNAVCGRIFVVGIREDTGAACGYSLDFMATWDGSAYTINGTSGAKSLTEVYNGASIVTAPVIECNTGSLRPKVTGIASTNIKWSAVITMASVNV